MLGRRRNHIGGAFPVLGSFGLEPDNATFRLNVRSRILKRVEEYRARAVECRKLAVSDLPPDLRLHYEAIADIWEKLANERVTFFMGDVGQNADRQIGKTGK
jgi:hypothetical protein